MSFQNLRGGDRVRVKVHAGIGPKGPEFAVRTARVNALLCFDTHVVADLGRGRPVIVNPLTFVERVK